MTLDAAGINLLGLTITSTDADKTSYLGRVALGTGGSTDHAAFGHRDYNNSSAGFRQDNNGDSIINGVAGIAVRIANNNKMVIAAADATFYDLNLRSNDYASQTTGWRITDDGQADFRYLFTDELSAKSFIADLEQALAGGQIIAKSVAMLSRDFTAPAAGGAATLYVRDLPSAADMAVFQSGDIVRLRQFTRASGSLTIADCWGVVTGYSNLAAGEQSWTFTRSSGGNAGAMATSTVVAADSIALDYGVSGNGFYEINAIDGAYGANSPYAQIVTWATHPHTGRSVRARWGNLAGVSIADYGLIMGTDVSAATSTSFDFRASDGSLRIGELATNKPNLYFDGTDLHLRNNTDEKITLASDGSSYFSGVMTLGVSGEIRQGSGTLGSNYTGLRIWRDGSIGRIGGYKNNALQWYANTSGELVAGAGNFYLDALGVNFQQDGYVTPDDARTISWWPTIATRGTGEPTQNIRAFYNALNLNVLQMEARGAGGAFTNAQIILTATTSAGASTSLTLGSDGYMSTDANLSFTGEIGQWSNFTLGTNWSAFGGAFATPGYSQFGNLVMWRGVVQAGSSPAATIFTLPSEARPSTQRVVAAWSYDGATEEMRRLNVFSSGAVQASGWTPANGDWISLEIIYAI
jgi:hypothetical protein